jgi:hypothetical protein
MRLRTRFPSLVFIFTAITGCALDTAEPEALDNDPPLSDLNALMEGAPKADDIPRELAKVDELAPRANSDLHSLMSPVKSQGKRGVCSIFSTVGLMEHLYIAAGHPTPDFSEQYLQWSTKFQLGAFPATSGSSDGINLQAINYYGIVAESVWPYQPVQWSTLEDPACTGEDDQPTLCYTNGHPSDEIKAAPKFFLPYGRWLNPYDIKGHILTKKTAVVAGMTFFYQSWNHGKSELPINPTYWNEGYVLYPNAKDQEVSTTEELSAGHAIVIFGWDDDLEVPIVDENGQQILDENGEPQVEKGFYLFKNSWGTAGFGINHPLGPGYGYISKRYIHDWASVRFAGKPAKPVEICGDGIDNDNDSLTDCADFPCSQNPECIPTGEVLTFDGEAGISIPDNDPKGITSTLNIDEGGTIGELVVNLNVSHTFRGDLRVELHHGGKVVVLHDMTGGSDDNLVGSYTVSDFIGADLAGEWKLVVSDRAAIDLGQLDAWSLDVRLN